MERYESNFVISSFRGFGKLIVQDIDEASIRLTKYQRAF